MKTAVLSCLCLGLVVGIPSYGMPYFYDYFEQAFGWSRAAIMLGLPVGTLVTLVAGPLFVRRLPSKPRIACGAAPLGAIFGCVLLGRLTLALLPGGKARDLT